MRFNVNIQAMIAFYDENESVRRHSNAIKTMGHEEFAIALLCNYFSEKGYDAFPVGRSCLPITGNKGKRLDRWVKVEGRDGIFYYQTEIKAASFHGYRSGKAFPSDPSEQSSRMKEDFDKCWRNGRFVDLGLDKVLHTMRTDELGSLESHAKIRPLACLWAPLHRDDWDVQRTEPLFEVKGVKDSKFDSVWIFSCSAYLRQCLHGAKTHIELDLPEMAERLKHLRQIYTEPVSTT
jgi:hypothetical protein